MARLHNEWRRRTTGRRWAAILTTVGLACSLFGLSLQAPVSALVGTSAFDAGNKALDDSSSRLHIDEVADVASGSTDDSYSGGGPKEDDACPSVDLSHAAPPKADLTRSWYGTDSDAPGIIYLAWERKSATGTLTVDFELNQVATPCANGINPVRTNGDLLVTYDFQGGTSIAVEVRKWAGSKWGPVNAIADSNYDASIRADESFGELAINLFEAGILDNGANARCVELASGFAKSRTGATSAFETSTIKDFIKPRTSFSVSNCGILTIVKDARPDSGENFAFTTTGLGKPALLLDDDADPILSNSESFLVRPGEITVDETATAGWDLTSISCEGTGSDGVTTDATGLDIDLAIDDDVTCTFVNTQPGTITITKDAQPNNGRDFTFSSTGGLGGFTLDDDSDDTLASTAVFSDVAAGSYSFTEAGAAGWTLDSIDCGTKAATVDLQTRNVTFDVADGESVACTFVNVKTSPTISVTKTPTPSSVPEPGADVAFAVKITNGSPLPVTITEISDSDFGDVTKKGAENALVSATDCATGGLLQASNANNDSDTYECSFTSRVVGNGGDTHANLVTVSGADGDGVPVSATGNATVAITDVLPQITVTKKASSPVVHAGETVTYTYEVTTPSVEPLTVTAIDDKCAPVTFVGGDADADGKLRSGETWTYRCITTLDSTTFNTVTVNGADDENNTVQATATATVAVIKPAIAIDKAPSATSVAPNTTVVYTYTVTNPGDVPLSAVAVSDDKCSPVTLASGDANGDGLLQMSETWVFRCSQVQTGSPDTLTNVGTATGTDLLGLVVQATDTVTVSVVAPLVLDQPTPQGVVAEPVALTTIPAPAPAAGAPVTLPRTGIDVNGWIQLGTSLILLGVSLLITTRSRRRRTA